MALLLCVLQLTDNQIIESKLIQVNKKKIVYIFVIPKKGCIFAPYSSENIGVT